jgi:hypothetical protein
MKRQTTPVTIRVAARGDFMTLLSSCGLTDAWYAHHFAKAAPTCSVNAVNLTARSWLHKELVIAESREQWTLD